jgi:hypothetical protein
MANITRKEIEVPVEHPLEKAFNIEPGTTLVPQVVRSTELTTIETYDEKDSEIETQFQEVYDAAMGAFEGQFQEADLVEGKYKARVGEVAVQFLNTALQAAQNKSLLKQHKDKIAEATKKNSTPNTVNNNLIVADRNEILKKLMGDKDNNEVV